LKSKTLLTILAAIPMAIMPLAAASQLAPERTKTPPGTPNYKYEAFAQAGYTSLNQVNQSRYGLIGGIGGVTRDFGRHFGITVQGDYYKWATGSGNPGNPSVYDILAGPELHATLYGNFDGYFHGLLGMEHTGGVGKLPDNSFAGGVGGGVDYNLSQHWAVRASGDWIAASFSLNFNTPQLNYSPHKYWNPRGQLGIVYRF
jgi:opacity protein-like surface antigen